MKITITNMPVNISFLIVAYIISQFVDWIFQWDWQAVNKSKWQSVKRIVKGKFVPTYETPYNKLLEREFEEERIEKPNYGKSLIAVWTHSLVYVTLTTIPLMLIFDLNPKQFDLIWNVLFWSHMVIDTRIPVRWVMRFKGMSWEQINDYDKYGFMHIGIDQRLHELVLLILAFIV